MNRMQRLSWIAASFFATAILMATAGAQAAIVVDCSPTALPAADDPLPCVVSESGPGSANDDITTMQNALSIGGITPVAVFDLAKLETPGGWSGSSETEGPLTVEGDASLVIAGDGGTPGCTATTCGTWIYSGPEEIVYVTVKGAGEFSIHSASEVVTSSDGSSTSGIWYTTLLRNNSGGIPALSHLTVWAEMNEPVSLAIFAAGMAGIAWRRRRRVMA